MSPVYILRSFLVAMTSIAISYACPQKCDCRNAPTSGIVVECRDQQFFDIPTDFPQDTVDIYFSGCKLPNIKSTSFPVLSKVKNITFEYCVILNEIDSHAFERFPSLLKLRIVSSQMVTLHQDAFAGISSVKYLYFQKNKLYSIPDLEFRELNLIDLYLDENQLHDLYNRTFSGTSVENLILDGNDLNQLNRDDLEPLKMSLKVLSVRNNRRTLVLDGDAFDGLHLDELILSNSQIIDHSFMGSLETKVLDISGNPFKDLNFQIYTNLNIVKELFAHNLNMDFMEDSMFSPFTGVRRLSIAQNNIILISSKVFDRMSNLTTLNMGSNSFILLPDDFGKYLPKVETLQFARCHLMTLSPSSFQGMNKLTTIDLRNNKLQVLDKSMKAVFEHVGVLGLEGNPFHCNCEMKWFREWIEEKGLARNNYQCFSPSKINILELDIDAFQCSPPVITRIASQIEAVAGEDVLLKCVATGDPAPDVQWVYPGGVIKVSAAFNRTILSTTGVMTLRKIDNERSGTYMCIASNSLGTVNGTTSINVVTSRTVSVSTKRSSLRDTSPSHSTEIPFSLRPTSITYNSSGINSTISSVNISLLANFSLTVFNDNSILISTTLDPRNQSSTLPYKKRGKVEDKYIIIAVVLSIFSIVVIALTIVVIITRRKKKKYDVNEGESAKELTTSPAMHLEVVKDTKHEEKQKLTTEL